MKRRQRRLHFLPASNRTFRNFRRGISLHGHTQHSRESLGFISGHIDTVPVVAQLARNAMARYRNDYGEEVDFNRAFWTAPLSPDDAIRLERRQIEDVLGLQGSVSLTDHDNIDGAMELPVDETGESVVSLEWTLPYGPVRFHLGVHNLPRAKARELARRLFAYTALPDESQLPALLATFEAIPEVLLVLNHPFWADQSVGRLTQHQTLHSFLRSYGGYIHALEVSGIRSWPENQEVLDLAERISMPVVSGGDRHGWEPSTMLNLTTCRSFAEFVQEIRQDGRSEIAVMPGYQQPFGLRMMHVAWDLLRYYPSHPVERQHWADRIFFEWKDGSVKPLSRCFKKCVAKELQLMVAVMMHLEQQPWHTLLYAAWSLRGAAGRVPSRRDTRTPAPRPVLPGGERSVA
jgi:hypothetical protein